SILFPRLSASSHKRALQRLPSQRLFLPHPSPACPYSHWRKCGCPNRATSCLVWQGAAYEPDDSLRFQACYNKDRNDEQRFLKKGGHQGFCCPHESSYDRHIVPMLPS